MQFVLSARAEKALSQMTVGCLDYEKTGKSTQAGALFGTEVAAQVCDLKRPAFLSIAIWAGFDEKNDIQELKGYLFRDVITKSDWFCIKEYLRAADYRRKVDGLVLGVITHLVHRQDDVILGLITERMGITRQAYTKTWQSRTGAVQQKLQDWLIDAATQIHKSTANE